MADFDSKYTGQQVEDLLDQVASGNAGGGGGGITAETDPIFSESPAADITDEKMVEWDNKYTKPSGGIPQSDLTEEVKRALRKAEQYTGTVNEIKVNGNNIGASGGVVDLGNLGTYSKPSTGIPKSDLNPSVQTSLGKADTAVQPADIREEVYIADFTITSLREGMINGSYVNCDMQALVAAMNANKIILVRDDADSSYKGVYVLNGYAEDLLYFSIVDTAGNVLYCDGTDYVYTKSYINGQTLFYRSWDDKQDKLQSGTNIKTINGESIVGSGDITIAGGSGEKGDKGDKGDTGATGVGVQSVKQTTISNTDGGSNVVTVTLTNGTTSTFTVKNGSKGSSGNNGTNGKDGADGATFTPSVDSAGNLSWTNNKGLTNPPTVNIKGPKGDKGDAGEGGGSGGGKEVVSISNGVIELLERDKIYIVSDSSNSRTFEIQAIDEVWGPGEYAEYHVIFASEDDMGMGNPLSIILPDNVYWANGQIPDLTLNANYELSIVGWGTANNQGLNAVITPFKSV